MSFVHETGAALGRALTNIRAGVAGLVSRRLAQGLAPTLRVTSDDVSSGEPLPVFATADGEGRPPSLRWSGVPAGTQSIVVVAEDPDAPFPLPFVHWLVYDLPASG